MPREDDSGHLLLLAGFVLAVALVVTGITLSEVAELEKEAAREQDVSFVTEYRSARDKLGAALRDSISSGTQVPTFQTTFGHVSENFHQLENTRGYNFLAGLAGGTNPALCTAANAKAAKSECVTYTVADVGCASGRRYAGSGDPIVDGAPIAQGGDGVTKCYDGSDDGIVTYDGKIIATFVYLYLDDPAARIEEVVLYALNR